MSHLRKGDYHRYLAEFATNTERKDAAENSLVAYKAASDVATTELPSTHPIRLGLALNFSGKSYTVPRTIGWGLASSDLSYGGGKVEWDSKGGFSP